MRHIEREHQKAVIQYLRAKYPTALYTIPPNGMKLPMGVAVQLKASGYVKGSPDIMIFEPRRYWHGLFIEMKAPKGEDNAKGVLKPEQKEWLNKLSVRGYCTAVCFGAQEAYQVIDAYFSV